MFNIIVAGVGGQGSILASHIIADAAIRRACENSDHQLKVRLGETFGAAMRGGAVASHVKIGRDVYNPLIPENRADVILGLEPLETLRAGLRYIKPGGRVIMNIRKYEPVDVNTGKSDYPTVEKIVEAFDKIDSRVTAFDATGLAVECGTFKSMNVVMLGALANCSLPFSAEDLEGIIKQRVPEKTISINLRAFQEGFKKARQLWED